MIFKEKAVSFVWPSLEMLLMNRIEMLMAAYAIFDAMEKKIISTTFNQYSFDGIIQAHIDLESGKSTGAAVALTF
jgi:hypothetical protein